MRPVIAKLYLALLITAKATIGYAPKIAFAFFLFSPSRSISFYLLPDTDIHYTTMGLFDCVINDCYHCAGGTHIPPRFVFLFCGFGKGLFGSNFQLSNSPSYPHSPERGEFVININLPSSLEFLAHASHKLSPLLISIYVAGALHLAHFFSEGTFRASNCTFSFCSARKNSSTTVRTISVVEPKSYSYNKTSPIASDVNFRAFPTRFHPYGTRSYVRSTRTKSLGGTHL